MTKHILKESEFINLIAKLVMEALDERQYGDGVHSKTSVKTGGYGGVNDPRGNRGKFDAARGDKPEYFAGLPIPSDIEIYSPQKMAFFKAKNFGANGDNIKSSLSIFQNIGEMGWEMNNLQSASKGNINWKVITDDPNATASNKGVTGKHLFWMVKLPNEDTWKLFKPNMSKRYASDYNPTQIKRINR